jgi:hypothetical protein
VKFGAPSRVAYAPGTEWLYVADASNHQVVALNIPSTSLGSRASSRGVLPGARPPARKVG